MLKKFKLSNFVIQQESLNQGFKEKFFQNLYAKYMKIRYQYSKLKLQSKTNKK